MHDFHPTCSGGPHFDAALFLSSGKLGFLAKGGGAPKPNKKLEQMQEQLIKAQLKQAGQHIALPEIAVPPPAPPDPPPPGQTASDVTNAEQDARRLAGKRRGIQSTLLSLGSAPGAAPAGGTGLGGKKTLLG